MQTIRVFVAESYPLFRQAVQELLSNSTEFSLAGITNTYQNLPEQESLASGNVLLIDLSEDPQQACLTIRDVKTRFPDLAVIAIDVERESNYLRKCLQHQADGFLLKTVESSELLHAIRTVGSGKKYIQLALREQLPEWLTRISIRKKNETVLTKREKEVLHLIVEELTTKEIADRLFVSMCTVETHRLHLINKLGVKNTAGLVREAIQLHLYQPGAAIQ